ncbi:ArnT family glycosyltransferase [Sodalis sp. RH22]|uniref:ArnT family glycosyltransferase n=1 Tax=unclassified Sodalis (in: enterobacteria) TaxID=2636512 RepID=UPI0039B4C7E0
MLLKTIKCRFSRADATGDGAHGRILLRRGAYLLFAAYFLLGTFGRFPWKADEPYSFSIVWNMLTHGHWLVPHVGGDPFLEKPPLMFWLGALCARLIPWLPPHESSRLAVPVCLVATFWACCRVARRLYDERHDTRREEGVITRQDWRLTAVCLLAGTAGLTEHGHKFTADLGQMAGAAVALAGLALAGARPGISGPAGYAASPGKGGRYGLLFGLGAGVAFLSKGLLVPGIAGVTLMLCLALIPGFHQRAGRRFWLGAATAALPFALPWPWALYRADPDLFAEWFWVNNIGRFTGNTLLGGHDNPFQDRIRAVLIGGAPASVIVLAGVFAGLMRAARGGLGRLATGRLWHKAAGPEMRPARAVNAVPPAGRIGLSAWLAHRPAYGVTALFSAVGVAVLCASGSARDIYLLPVYPALALLALPAAAGLACRDGKGWAVARRALDALFGMALMVVVATWSALANGIEPVLLRIIWPGVDHVFPLPFTLRPDPLAAMAACGLVSLWWLILRARRGAGLLLAWTSGLSTLWGVAFVLLMPWFDAARSYKEAFSPLANWVGDAGCLATDGMGESELGMLHYVTGMAGRRLYAGHSGQGDGVTKNSAVRLCTLLLVQDSLTRPEKKPGPRWLPLWRGGRPADDNSFTLYRLASQDERMTDQR